MSIVTLGLCPFDLSGIFECAVELGMRIHDEREGAESASTEVASERLRAVLNPRNAKFPINFEWFQFQMFEANGLAWPQGPAPRPGWSQEIDRADASALARQALLTLGLALADLRGDEQSWDRGRTLLSDGTWNLWDGLNSHDRQRVQPLLGETHRIWGWPKSPTGVPGEFRGAFTTLADYRVLSPGWRTGIGADLQARVQAVMQTENYLVDGMFFSRQNVPLPQFEWYRHDCLFAPGTRPSICPKADPKPPVELMPEGQLLAAIEASYRRLSLIGADQTIHWVGRQRKVANICTCDLSALACNSEPAASPAPDGTALTSSHGPTFLSAPELARQLGQHSDGVEAFLRRYRVRYPDCFIEVDAPRRGEARYLYRVADVWRALQDRQSSVD